MKTQGRYFLKAWTLLVLALLIGPADTSLACPNCVRALSTKGAGASAGAATAFNASILFMLAVPFSVAGFFGLAFWRLSRRGATSTAECGGSEAEKDQID